MCVGFQIEEEDNDIDVRDDIDDCVYKQLMVQGVLEGFGMVWDEGMVQVFELFGLCGLGFGVDGSFGYCWLEFFV